MIGTRKKALVLAGISVMCLLFLYAYGVYAGPYLDSAHGDTNYGVNRTSTSTLGYYRGNCAHCHEQHGSIEGAEPDPDGGGPSDFTVFYDNYVNQTDGFCFQCHTDSSSVQTVVNRSYSYRAGNFSIDTVNDVLEQFSFVSPGSSHNLNNIRQFLDAKWGYTLASNPCAGCHNPHRATGDPEGPANANVPKPETPRGYPVARPSDHSTDNTAWVPWGDDAAEKMDSYASPKAYQAPYRFSSTTFYEPDGSQAPNDDGSRLTDFVTFCNDCHNHLTDTITSSERGLLTKTDWDNEKHGKLDADLISVQPPYDGAGTGTVMACTDCHEPHGSESQVLIRSEVNGKAVAVITDVEQSIGCSTPNTVPYTNTNKEIAALCVKCHQDDDDINGSCQNNKFYIIHHDAASGDPPYAGAPYATCGNCHSSGSGTAWDCNSDRSSISCNCCHYHGSSVSGQTTF